MDNLKDKKILLCVTGSIAAFKACEFIRLLRKQGCNVKVVMSNSAQDFIGKLSLAALSDNEVLTESNQTGMGDGGGQDKTTSTATSPTTCSVSNLNNDICGSLACMIHINIINNHYNIANP